MIKWRGYDAFESKWIDCLGYGGEVCNEDDENYCVQEVVDGNDSNDEELVAGDADQLNEEVVEDSRHTLWSIQINDYVMVWAWRYSYL